jgi:hypothetical protein
MALHRVAPVSRSEALAMPATAVDRPTSAGLTLLGYDAGPAVPHAPGEDLTLTTYWRVDDLRPERAGWFVAAYYQILNAAAQIEANVNGRGQWGYRWQLGDVYVERAVVPLPAGLSGGDYRLIFGLFDPIHALDFPMVAAGGDAPFHSIPLAVAR